MLSLRDHTPPPLPLYVTQLFGGLHDISEQVGIAIILMLLLWFLIFTITVYYSGRCRLKSTKGKTHKADSREHLAGSSSCLLLAVMEPALSLSWNNV